MKRWLVPVGQFVAACRPGLKLKVGMAECFTITAYDPVMGQYIAMGHASPINMVGKSIYRAEGTIPVDGNEVINIVPLTAEAVGIVTRQASMGVSGPGYWEADTGTAILTDTPQLGRAWLVNDLLPEGGMEVEITSVTAAGAFSFKGGKCVKGMSGSPIVQNGRLVGLLWGMSKQYEGRSVEAMADRLLDAWAEEPAQIARKRIKRLPERIIRKEVDRLTDKVAELQAKAVGEILGPEAAEQVKQAVKEQGITAGTKLIQAMKESEE